MNTPSSHVTRLCLRWTARATALGLFLLWGAFFLEHLGEWFLWPEKGLPPWSVWVGQLLHFAVLAGLLLLACWPGPGALLTLAGTLAFFGWIGLLFQVNAIWMALVTLIPAGLVAADWLIGLRASRRPRADVPAQ